MPSNTSGMAVGYLAGRYPGRLGHLFSPGAQRGPWPFMPYALDNGAFPAFSRRAVWEAKPYHELLAWAKDSGQAPLWALVPDVVGDAEGTLRAWDIHAERVAAMGWPLAFAAQDGMTFDDVPREAAVVFIGGSTEWKRQAVVPWCRRFPRVHVGRINTDKWLRFCEDAGAESVDGTGWFRGRLQGRVRLDTGQAKELTEWLAEVSGEKPRRPRQSSLSFDDFGTAVDGSACCETAALAPAGGRK